MFALEQKKKENHNTAQHQHKGKRKEIKREWKKNGKKLWFWSGHNKLVSIRTPLYVQEKMFYYFSSLINGFYFYSYFDFIKIYNV